MQMKSRLSDCCLLTTGFLTAQIPRFCGVTSSTLSYHRRFHQSRKGEYAVGWIVVMTKLYLWYIYLAHVFRNQIWSLGWSPSSTSSDSQINLICSIELDPYHNTLQWTFKKLLWLTHFKQMLLSQMRYVPQNFIKKQILLRLKPPFWSWDCPYQMAEFI